MKKEDTEIKKDKRDLHKAIIKLNEKYKKNLILRGSDITIKRVSTGLLSIDNLMGGGLPIGKWCMWYGSKGVAKTSLCYHLISIIQKSNGKVLYVDAEHGFDKEYSASFGVNANELYLVTPSTLEESVTALKELAPYMNLIIVDSITAVGSEQEIIRDLEKDTMALIPRKLSQFFRIATPIVGHSNAAVVLINQTRMDLGAYVPIDKYPGGNALSHYCSFIMKMRRSNPDDFPKKVVNGKEINSGIRIICKAEKSKISSTEGQETFFDLFTDEPHFDEYADLLSVAEVKGKVINSGAWFYFGEKKFQGREKIINELKNNKDFFISVKKSVSI